MSAEIGIVDLLRLCGFDPSCRSKLVRHQDKHWNSHDLLRRGWLEAYQSFQNKPVFDNLDYIVSFVGLGGTHARLLGLYKVCARRPGESGALPAGCPHVEWQRSVYYYELERQPGFEALEHRLVIEWGRGALAWHQYTTNKPVVQILPVGHLLRLFTDYLDFTLTHGELRYLFNHQEANREWRARLSAVAGVYLILATTTGRQYVGSAYGADGLWGRWAAYAADGHGGNVLLRDLIATDRAYPDAFTYSLLQILPKTATLAETLHWERLYKEKLGSMATGLNAN
jgi:hypothetical protein